MPDPVEVVLQEIDRAMDDYIDRVFELSQQFLVDQNKIDTGTLFKTANIERRFLEKTIVYPAPHADDIEYGRVAGTMPPVDPIIAWVKRKLAITNEKEARQTAWAIAFTIKQRGTQPSPYLTPSIIQANNEFGLRE